jgi:hypothetical protein
MSHLKEFRLVGFAETEAARCVVLNSPTELPIQSVNSVSAVVSQTST